VTAGIRAFLERLWFGGLAYNPERFVVYDRRIPVAVILTTNAPTAGSCETLNRDLVEIMGRFIGPTELIEANDTLQFDDYSLYDSAMFDPDEKKKSRIERFPKDLECAYQTGKNLIDSK
jgi:hypothetical protein